MARPTSNGLSYYNIDTDRYADVRIRKLKKEFKCIGISVYDYLLNGIYGHGCFLLWDENTTLDVAEYFDLKMTTVDEVVNYCCSVGLFNRELFANENILTSSSIQTRYLLICKKAKIKYNIPKRYELVSTEDLRKSTEEMTISSVESTISSVESTQSKVKKRKEEGEEYSGTGKPPPDLSKSNLYRQPISPTKQQVWEFFSGQGKTKEMAKSFYEKWNATNWFFNGSPIINWADLANRFITNWTVNDEKKVSKTNEANSAPPLRK